VRLSQVQQKSEASQNIAFETVTQFISKLKFIPLYFIYEAKCIKKQNIYYLAGPEDGHKDVDLFILVEHVGRNRMHVSDDIGQVRS